MNEMIGFIGGGNMARSLIAGLLASGCEKSTIFVADPEAEQRTALAERFGVRVDEDNNAVAEVAETLVLAVKPQQLAHVARQIAATCERRSPLIVSIAAGIDEPAIRRWLGYPASIVRCMPNTPSLLGCGASALFANDRVGATQRETAERILSTAGIVIWVDEESKLDAVTAVSGSGPAYFFLLMEAMERSGVKLGLTEEQARRLVAQTALGAARMIVETGESASTLRARVTSPGGTTERAIGLFQQGGFEAIVDEAMDGAATRCRELSEQLGGQS